MAMVGSASGGNDARFGCRYHKRTASMRKLAMDRHAYCTECGRYVMLAGEVCPAGHGGDSLRDIRSGALPGDVVQRQSQRPGPTGQDASGGRAGRARAAGKDSTESVGRVMGWLVVLVPALGLGVIMVAVTEPQYEGMHLGTVGSWMAAFVTVVVALGAALGWGWLKFVRNRR